MTRVSTNKPILLESKFRQQIGARSPLKRGRLELPKGFPYDETKVITIVAPAGYGKSTLMSQWFSVLQAKQDSSIGIAWLNLDDNDNDAIHFLRYLISAAEIALPRLNSDGALNITGPISAKSLLELLSAKLSDIHQQLVLFIDDAHLLSDPQAVEAFEWLVRYAPSNLRFVIGCRQVPRIGLAELRVHGQLVEIDQSALAFQIEEIATFCEQRLLRRLDSKMLRALMQKTEGWAAALELLTVALNDSSDAAQLLEDFAATERGVMEYLGEVVFNRLEADLQLQIYRLAQFDRFCSDLSMMACGPKVDEDLIQELQKRRLFLIPLDSSGKWFRFHHLVRDFLRTHPPKGSNVLVQETLLSGGQWFYENGMVDDAIECSVRAKAWDQACQWLASSVEDLTPRMGGTAANLRRWMNLIPREHINRHPVIRISHVFSLAILQEHELVEKELHDLESLTEQWQRDPSIAQSVIDDLLSAVTLQRLLIRGLNDDGHDMLAAVEAWLQKWPNARDRFRGDALNVAAFSCKTNGHIDQGISYAQQAYEVHKRDGGYLCLSWSQLLAALLHLKRGDYPAAQQASEAGLQLVIGRMNNHPEHASFHRAVLSAIYYEFDDIPRASEELDYELAAIDATGTADFLILTYLTRARLQFRLGQNSAGLEALRLGRKLGQRRHIPRLCVTLAGEECIWLSRLGEHASALDLARQFDFDRSIYGTYNVVADKAARVGPRLLLSHSPEMAVAQLKEALARSTEKGFHHRRTELLILQSIALLRSNREEEAFAAWSTALNIATKYGYRRVFLDDAEIISTITYAARGKCDFIQPSWLQTVQASEEKNAEDALTKKEIRILKHLESSRVNREIAESLFISEGTLKWHLHNIYRKLGSKNRLGTLTAARQLGYL